MKDKGTNEEVTDEEWKACAKITDKDWMKDSPYNSVIPSFTEPVFVSNKTIGYKDTHHFYQNKILKIKKRKINLTLSIEM
jgi:hypothetical protein